MATQLLPATLRAAHMCCGTLYHRTKTSWPESISTLCARDPSLDEHALMGLLSPIMTQ